MDWELMRFKKDIDILGLYSFFYFERSKDFCFAGERHDFWEMVYVDVGEIAVIAEDDSYMLRQGEVIFHKPMEFHALASNKKDPHNVLVVSFSTQSEMMGLFENKIFAPDGIQRKILTQLLETGREIFSDLTNNMPDRNTKIGSGQLLTGYLEEFLIMLARCDQAGTRVSRKSSRNTKNVENILVEHIENYLSDNIYNNITLNDVCERFNMSKSYLCEVFKGSTGGSIIDFYISMKIAEAKRLIRQGDYNFTQIADKLQYSGIHHFSRMFKRVTGLSPSAYSKSVR